MATRKHCAVLSEFRGVTFCGLHLIYSRRLMAFRCVLMRPNFVRAQQQQMSSKAGAKQEHFGILA